ncbi:hypothetical protein DL98DRAFT_661319 [Cadophora sp. DSE1049]|nr:hypothetical protein DL98DRAFT_661319 [Cadophora sp. DSE1049]
MAGQSGMALESAATATPKPSKPVRPRRKKARRACSACKKAHLTCGDERPCQRCIKRKIGHNCQDGEGKKSKYRQDAPSEDPRPDLGPDCNAHRNSSNNNGPSTPSIASELNPSPSKHPLLLYFESQPSLYGQPTMQETSVPQVSTVVQTSLGVPLFDPSDPALFNFDLESLDFGNHHGTSLESGTLRQMSPESQRQIQEYEDLGFTLPSLNPLSSESSHHTTNLTMTPSNALLPSVTNVMNLSATSSHATPPPQIERGTLTDSDQRPNFGVDHSTVSGVFCDAKEICLRPGHPLALERGSTPRRHSPPKPPAPEWPTQDDALRAVDTVLQYLRRVRLVDEVEFMTIVKLRAKLRSRSCSGGALPSGLQEISK